MSDLVHTPAQGMTGDVARLDVGRVRAELETAFVIAQKFPRDMDQVLLEMKKRLKKPEIASAAMYTLPIGGKPVSGFSIRYVEAVVPILKHLRVRTTITSDDDEKMIFAVAAWDLQNNILVEVERVVPKTVERKDIRGGRRVLYQRKNSQGQDIFIIAATEEEARKRIGSEQSKQFRDCVQRLIPRDFLDECAQQIRTTLSKSAAQDPEKAKKDILEGFDRLGISVPELKSYLDRPIEDLTPDDIAELRTIWRGLKDEEFTFTDLLEMKKAEAQGDPEPGTETNVQAKARKLRDRLMGKPDPGAGE